MSKEYLFPHNQWGYRNGMPEDTRAMVLPNFNLAAASMSEVLDRLDLDNQEIDGYEYIVIASNEYQHTIAIAFKWGPEARQYVERMATPDPLRPTLTAIAHLGYHWAWAGTEAEYEKRFGHPLSEAVVGEIARAKELDMDPNVRENFVYTKAVRGQELLTQAQGFTDALKTGEETLKEIPCYLLSDEEIALMQTAENREEFAKTIEDKYGDGVGIFGGHIPDMLRQAVDL